MIKLLFLDPRLSAARRVVRLTARLNPFIKEFPKRGKFRISGMMVRLDYRIGFPYPARGSPWRPDSFRISYGAAGTADFTIA